MAGDEDLFFLGVTREHCNRTDLAHAIRELATNAIDADPTLPLADSVHLTDTYSHVRAVIVNKAAHGLEQDHLLQGPSQKKDDSRFFGGFGCGLKDAMAIFVREGIEVEILTRTWCGRVIEDVRPCSNPAFRTTKREVCVARRTSTTADLDRLEVLMAGAAVAFVLSARLRSTTKLRAAVDQCMLGELGQYSNAPLELATHDGCWRFKHQGDGQKKNFARLTLRGVYWMDLPMRGCGDLVFDLHRLSPQELQAIGRDRRNLKVGTIAGTVARAVKHLVANIDSLPSALQDAVAEAAHVPGINNAVSTALEPLRQRASAAAAALPTTTVAHSLAPSQPLFQAPVVPPAPLVPQQSKAAKLREAKDEIQRLQRLLTKHCIDYSPGAVAYPTGLFMPSNTTEGLTSWAKHHALSEGADESLDTLVFQMKRKLVKLGFKDPVVTGSTARRCALRGESVDLDIAVWVDTQVPESTDIFGDFVETDEAFVFTPSDGNVVVVHCDLVHKSYRQHPIDVQFFPDEESYKAQIAFMKTLCDGPHVAHASMLTVALKKWARNVLSVATASSGDLKKVPGWAFEMIAMQATADAGPLLQTLAGDPLLPPALFVSGLKAVSSPPAAVRTGCDIDGAAFTALKTAAARTIPNYTP